MGLTHIRSVSAMLLLTGSYSLTAASAEIDGNPEKAVPIVISVCATCHGLDGNSPSPKLPKLAGQTPTYLLLELKAFKDGHRTNTTMAPIVATLSEDDMANLASYFSGQKPSPGVVTKPELVALGKKIYLGENATGDALSCDDCHGDNGVGSDKYPRIGGQHVQYTLEQISLLATHVRKTEVKGMRIAAEHLTSKEADAVAQYLASMK